MSNVRARKGHHFFKAFCETKIGVISYEIGLANHNPCRSTNEIKLLLCFVKSGAILTKKKLVESNQHRLNYQAGGHPDILSHIA